MRFSIQLILQTRTSRKFIVPEADFHTDLIGASSVIIVHKTAKLFRFLQVHSQCEHTIVNTSYSRIDKLLPLSSHNLSTLGPLTQFSTPVVHVFISNIALCSIICTRKSSSVTCTSTCTSNRGANILVF